jgi:phage gp36-like protein
MSSYASLADLYKYGAPATAFGVLSGADQQAGLDEASAKIDEFLAARYPLPLISWPVSITEYAARIAAYNLLSVRGYNPAIGNEGDTSLKSRYDDAIRQLTLIQKQQMHPAVVAQPNQAPTYEQPAVYTSSVVSLGTGGTDTTRGW